MKLPGLFQILVIAMIIIVLFGRGRMSELMGDFGRGLKNFRRGVSDDEPAPVEAQPAAPGLEVRAAGDRPAL